MGWNLEDSREENFAFERPRAQLKGPEHSFSKTLHNVHKVLFRCIYIHINILNWESRLNILNWESRQVAVQVLLELSWGVVQLELLGEIESRLSPFAESLSTAGFTNSRFTVLQT